MREMITIKILACVMSLIVIAKSPATPPPPPSAVSFMVLAKQWFYRCRNGTIDRTQLEPQESQHMTPAVVRGYRVQLKPYRNLRSFRLLTMSQNPKVIAYEFEADFQEGRVEEQIAIDQAGKIASINFATY